jgi:hypothetical protein
MAEPCEVPGCGRIGQRHHDDYNDPLNIRWLCQSRHHPQADRERRLREQLPGRSIIGHVTSVQPTPP